MKETKARTETKATSDQTPVTERRKGSRQAVQKGTPDEAPSTAGPAPQRPAANEIDDIFAMPKKRKQGTEPEGQHQAANAAGKAAAPGTATGTASSSAGNNKKAKASGASAAPSGKRPQPEGSKDDIFGALAGKGGKKRTEEGFRVYSEEELGLGRKGGDTAQCPFDCDCCF